MLLGLTNAQRFGLAGVAVVFIAFSLLCALVIPRYRPDFPGGRRLRLFIAVVVVLLVAMLGAVEVFAREEEEPHEEAAAETTEGGETAATTTEAAPTTRAETTTEQPTTGGGETTVQNPADPSALQFQKSALRAPAGTITLVMENPSAIEHNIAVRGQGVDEQGEVVGQGEESTVTVELEPGEYEFYCSVPGHEEAGMKGTLSVSGA